MEYAVINSATNIVENVVLWNGDVDIWQPPAGTYTQSLEGTEAGIGWEFKDGVFTDARI